MRKAVPVALVLIAGAAVVLWFGNRLNSWVLGGLIGGLASLLLSVPISLTLFAYFARQHDAYERSTHVSHKRLLSRRSTPLTDYSPHEIDADYADDEYGLVDDEISTGEVSTKVEGYYQPPTRSRNSGWLDKEFVSSVPPVRQFLPPGASRKTTTISHQKDGAGEERKTRRLTARRTPYPGLPGSQQAQSHSHIRSQALHTARLEAARQHGADDEQELVWYEDAPSIRRQSRYVRGRRDDNQTQ